MGSSDIVIVCGVKGMGAALRMLKRTTVRRGKRAEATPELASIMFRFDAPSQMWNLATFDGEVGTRVEVSSILPDGGTDGQRFAVPFAEFERGFKSVAAASDRVRLDYRPESGVVSLAAGTRIASVRDVGADIAQRVYDIHSQFDRMEVMLTVVGGEWQGALAHVAPAMSDAVTRLNLHGLHINADRNSETINLAATDGHRLHIATPEADLRDTWGIGDDEGVTLPYGWADAMARLPRKVTAGTVTLMVDPSKQFYSARFDASGVTLLAQRDLDLGDYPNVAQVIPDPGDGMRIELHRTIALDTFKAAVSAGEKSNHPVALTIGGGVMRVEGDAGFNATMECGEVAEAQKIGFNARYLVDALKGLEGDALSMQLTDDLSPVRFEGADSRRFSVVMPMRM